MELTLNTHRCQGGTFVTNFRADMWPVYRDAVRIYGEMASDLLPRRCPKRNLVLTDVPAEPAPRSYGGALHLVGGNFDLSDFWLVFDAVARMRGMR